MHTAQRMSPAQLHSCEQGTHFEPATTATTTGPNEPQLSSKTRQQGCPHHTPQHGFCDSPGFAWRQPHPSQPEAPPTPQRLKLRQRRLHQKVLDITVFAIFAAFKRCICCIKSARCRSVSYCMLRSSVLCVWAVKVECRPSRQAAAAVPAAAAWAACVAADASSSCCLMCAAPHTQLQLARQADAACIVVRNGGGMVLQPGPDHLASLQHIPQVQEAKHTHNRSW
jgi:hypothetical protein